jgi:hypothetical protein
MFYEINKWCFINLNTLLYMQKEWNNYVLYFTTEEAYNIFISKKQFDKLIKCIKEYGWFLWESLS